MTKPQHTMANKDFDFNSIGKRMPYTTPDGFFDQLEEDICGKISKRRPSRMRIVMRSVMAAAAAIAVLVVINVNFFGPQAVTVSDVDQAFSQLSVDDQNYLIGIYQEDVFMNE